MKILDLFAGTQSVRKDLKNIEYKGIDIYSPEEPNLILDLSQDNIVERIVELLGDWKPDFIWASPICNTFSNVITGMGGNYYYEVDKESQTIKPRENWNIKVQPHMKRYQNHDGWKKARETSELHLKLHLNTKKIIEYFNVPFAIENPANALTRYLYKDYERTVANYCMYGFDYTKATAFYSSKKLSLKKCDSNCKAIREMGKHTSLVGGGGTYRPRHWNNNISTYANRSSVPPKLITSIIEEIK